MVKKVLSLYNSLMESNSLGVHTIKGTLTSWLKTLVVAGNIFIKKDMWARDVAALTFATLMALIPAMAMMFVIARGFGYTVLLESWLMHTFEAQPIVAETIVTFVQNYLNNTQNSYIIGTGIVVLLYTVISLMQKIERTFNGIWHSDSRTWIKILTEYPTIFFCYGLMIIFSSMFNIVAVQVVENVNTATIIGHTFSSLFLHMAAFVPMFLFFVFCYCVIPNTHVKVKSTLVPSFLAGVSMSVLQYGYMYLQVYLSSYNIVYGSLAALPLFLLWLQISWAIMVFCGILCYTKQFLHHFDGDVKYETLSHKSQVDVCTMVMHYVCKRFNDGAEALTPKDIQAITGVPQQVINGAVKDLLRAKLIVEIKSSQRGVREALSRLHPIEKITNLSYGIMVERLDKVGTDVCENVKCASICDQTSEIRDRYYETGKDILLSELES